jgi:uncharacterized protein
MVRPVCCRRVGVMPGARYFKPRGIPMTELEEIVLALDEVEAVRLADLERQYQEQGAEKMKVSRQTFGRIIESAHQKIADALVNGKALKIEGGNIEMVGKRKFQCRECGHGWEAAYGKARPSACPECASDKVCRAEEDRGGCGRGGGRGNCCGQGPKTGRGRGPRQQKKQ